MYSCIYYRIFILKIQDRGKRIYFKMMYIVNEVVNCFFNLSTQTKN